MKKRPVILKIIIGDYEEEECKKCKMPEDECECEEESGDED
jgi:hypothetical protein